MNAKKILITGGTGLVGGALTELLLEKGYEVCHLSRKEDLHGQVKAYAWDYLSGKIDERALENTFAVVHLAGAGIADGRWTEARKKVIIDSRVETAKLLYQGYKRMGFWPKAFISSSGINYYGTATTDRIHIETDAPASGFIGRCCVLWEGAAMEFAAHCRVAMLRTGVVLSNKGGALPRISAPIRMGIGAALGSGKQWMPYIHIDDLCAMYLYAIEQSELSGPINASNGDHINNLAMTRTLAKVLGKPLWLPAVPGFLLKIVFGEMASLLLEGSRASSAHIEKLGFTFSYKELESALAAIYDHGSAA